MSQPACTCSEPGPGHELSCEVIQAELREGPPPTAQDLEMRAVARRLGRACAAWIADVEAEARREWEGEL